MVLRQGNDVLAAAPIQLADLRVEYGKTMTTGQSSFFDIFVEGLELPSMIHVANLAPQTLAIKGPAQSGTIQSCGGSPNTAKLPVQALHPGAFALRLTLDQQTCTDNRALQGPSISADQASMGFAADASSSVGGILRKAFLDWWRDWIEANCAFEGIEGMIDSLNGYPPSDDMVQVNTNNAGVALTKGAKKKLAKMLKDRAKELRDKAKDLRKDGKGDKADLQDSRAHAFDVAAAAVDSSMSSAAKP